MLRNWKLNFYDDRHIRMQLNEYLPTGVPTHILDLGAHKGFVSTFLAKKFPHAIIHCYEPNPVLFRKLRRRTRKYRNITAYSEALYASDGEVPFGISSRLVSSSIFGRGAKIEVPCISFATAVRRLGAPTYLYVKMDIEGAEFE